MVKLVTFWQMDRGETGTALRVPRSQIFFADNIQWVNVHWNYKSCKNILVLVKGYLLYNLSL